MQGTVKWFSEERGFGFIERADGEDVFVHYSGIESSGPGRRNLAQGQRVEFDIGEGRKGPEARDVRVIT